MQIRKGRRHAFRTCRRRTWIMEININGQKKTEVDRTGCVQPQTDC